MALTIYQTPSSYTPAFNEQWFVALSNQIAISDFYYRVIVTDLVNSNTQTYNIKQRPTTGQLVFPAHVFSQNQISHYVPNNAYGWQICTDAIRKIRVAINEYYSGSHKAATTTDYIIWNGVLRALDWPSYVSTDYVYNSDTTNLKYLSSLPSATGYQMANRVTYSDTSLFLYVLGSTSGDFQTLRVNTYDENNVLLGTSDIANPYELTYTYSSKYECIDIGHKGLSQIGSLLVTGTYPIITSSVAYYIIQDVSLFGSPAAASIIDVARVDIACEPTYDVYTLHYKAKLGNFETLHFNKNSEFTENIEKASYRVNPNTLVSNTYSYSKFSQWEKTLSSTGTDTIRLNTDWLTEAQVGAHREIIESPLVYIDYGSSTGLVPCKVLTSSILNNKEFNNKLFAIALEIEPTYRNNYGRS
jgi:hypothetical protein